MHRLDWLGRTLERGRFIAPIAAVITAVILTAAPTDSHAQSTATSRKYDGINRIAKGVTDIGLDNLWILSFQEQDDASTFRMSLTSGITARRFIKDNIAVGVNVSGFRRQFGETETEMGAMASLVANYYARLGSGMFVAPGIGVGGMFGTREQPTMTGLLNESTVVGGTLSLSLPLAFYAWKTFNVRAGLSMLVAAGSATPENGESTTFVTVDGGFNVGFGYYF